MARQLSIGDSSPPVSDVTDFDCDARCDCARVQCVRAYKGCDGPMVGRGRAARRGGRGDTDSGVCTGHTACARAPHSYPTATRQSLNAVVSSIPAQIEVREPLSRAATSTTYLPTIASTISKKRKRSNDLTRRDTDAWMYCSLVTF